MLAMLPQTPAKSVLSERAHRTAPRMPVPAEVSVSSSRLSRSDLSEQIGVPFQNSEQLD